MKILCIYHSSDLDGHCSGAIVKYKFPDCELLGLNHGDYYDMDKLKSYDKVFICDFSLPIDDMIELNKHAELIWCDHHITAINAMTDAQVQFNGLTSIDYSGCELTWNYLFPAERMPNVVWLLGRFDIWQHHLSVDILPFQLGMALNDTNPDNQELWGNFFNVDFSAPGNPINDTIRDGKVCEKYFKNQSTSKCKSAFETEINGYKAIALNNAPPGSSLVFDSVWDEEKYDLMIHFCRGSNSRWNMSFYTTKDDVDCSEIAKSLGGGGHRMASGTSTKELPFKI